MKFLQIETYIKKHTKSNDEIEGHITEASNIAMGLVNTPDLQLFKLEENIYITNVETDFILDIIIEVWIKFDNEWKVVAVADLYDLYCKAKDCEEEEIYKSNEIGRIWQLLHFNRRITKRPFKEIEEELKVVLYKSSIQNN